MARRSQQQTTSTEGESERNTRGMPEATKRVQLTSEQNQALRVHHDAHPVLSLRVLCTWAHSTFKLPRPPAHSTIVRALNSSKEAGTVLPGLKTHRPVVSTRLESELVHWITLCEQASMPIINHATIRAKALKIRANIAEDPTSPASTALMQLKFSNGWLQKFLRRHGVKLRHVHGEAASVDPEAVERGREALLKAAAGYDKCNTFNMDKTAFFYCMAFTTSISKHNMSGRKNVKKRLTVAITSNANGSFKLPLLFVGTARQPRCFGGRIAEELGVEYTNAPKRWMNTQLFQAWIEKFNDTMRSENRQVLLLLDNASYHQVDEQLSNVQVRMLPPNTTAHLQPQDAGIVRSFKAQVNLLKNRYYVDAFDDLQKRSDAEGKENVDRSAESIFHVNILTAMWWAQEAWQRVTSSTIENCWRHTGIVDEDFYELVGSMEKVRIGPPSIRQLVV